MKECQVQALLTLNSADDALMNGVVERIDCAECDRHVEFRACKEFMLLFPKAYDQILLAELCKGCEAAEMHKCDGCKHKEVYIEPKFQDQPICSKARNLVEAVKAFYAEECPFDNCKENDTFVKDGGAEE